MRSIIFASLTVSLFACEKPQKAGEGDGASKSSSGRTVIQNKGSDTLVNVAQAWAETYKTVDANVAIAVTGGGSGTGVSSMINGTVDIANASRAMKAKEIEAAKKNGIDPKEHIVGYDALAIFLHPANPMTEISIEQIKAIYGEGGAFDKWSDLGIEIPGCPSDEIVRVSRQNNSGTYAYFKKATLGKGEYKLGSRDMHGSKDVVDLVEKTPAPSATLASPTQTSTSRCRVKKDADSACVLDRSCSRRQLPHHGRSSCTPRAQGRYRRVLEVDSGRCRSVHHRRQGLPASATSTAAKARKEKACHATKPGYLTI